MDEKSPEFGLFQKSEEFYLLKERMTRMEVLMIGYDGKNGLRGDVTDIKDMVEKLSSSVKDRDKHIDQQLEEQKKLQWKLVGAFTVISFLAPFVIGYFLK